MQRNKKLWSIHKKSQLIKIVPEEVQILELLDKDFISPV